MERGEPLAPRVLNAWLDAYGAAFWANPMLPGWHACSTGRRQNGLGGRWKGACDARGRCKPLADFAWAWPEQCDQAAIRELMTLDFLRSASHAILLGPSGLGKTTIAQNIAHAAVRHGYTVLFATAGQLLGELASLDSDAALRYRLRRYAAPSLLVVDEFGYLSCANRHADPLRVDQPPARDLGKHVCWIVQRSPSDDGNDIDASRPAGEQRRSGEIREKTVIEVRKTVFDQRVEHAKLGQAVVIDKHRTQTRCLEVQIERQHPQSPLCQIGGDYRQSRRPANAALDAGKHKPRGRIDESTLAPLAGGWLAMTTTRMLCVRRGVGEWPSSLGRSRRSSHDPDQLSLLCLAPILPMPAGRTADA